MTDDPILPPEEQPNSRFRRLLSEVEKDEGRKTTDDGPQTTDGSLTDSGEQAIDEGVSGIGDGQDNRRLETVDRGMSGDPSTPVDGTGGAQVIDLARSSENGSQPNE